MTAWIAAFLALLSADTHLRCSVTINHGDVVDMMGSPMAGAPMPDSQVHVLIEAARVRLEALGCPAVVIIDNR